MPTIRRVHTSEDRNRQLNRLILLLVQQAIDRANLFERLEAMGYTRHAINVALQALITQGKLVEEETPR